MNDIKLIRKQLKQAFGDVELLRVKKINDKPFICLIDILEHLFNYKRNERSGIESSDIIKKIKKGNKIKYDLLTPYSGNQSTNFIDALALLEVLAYKMNYKLLKRPKYNEYIKHLKESQKK